MTNFSSSGIVFFAETVVFITICIVMLILRFAAMRISRRKFFMDDGLVLFAFLNAFILGIAALWSTAHGMGKSVDMLSKYEIAATAKFLFTAYVCWLFSSVFYKLAILALYSRVFTTPTFRWWSYAFSAVTVAYCVGYFAVFVTSCIPVDHLWNPRPGGHCRDGRISDFSTLTINIILDLGIIVLPLPTLWGLQLPTKKKIIVTVMLSFGFLTIAVMIWRFVWTEKFRGNPDFTTYVAKIGTVCMLELWLGIMVACIPTLAPLFRADRFARTGSGSGRGGARGSSSWSSWSSAGGCSYQTSKRPALQRSARLRDDGYDVVLERRSSPTALESGEICRVTAECAFDPDALERASPMAPDAIYVRTNIDA